MMSEQEGILLRALDGSNPLAFLAALGAFRLLTLESLESKIQMRWERVDGAWRPRLRGVEADEEELCRKLHESTHWAPAAEFMDSLKYIETKKEKKEGRKGEGKQEKKEKVGFINVPTGIFKAFIDKAYDSAKPIDRRYADFATAFGCEICAEKNGEKIQCTDLCLIRGSGNQYFLSTMVKLRVFVNQHDLYDALFGVVWRGKNTEKGMSLRWDPSDATEYALQWKNPGDEGAWSVWGANLLASEGLPFYPTAPTGGGLQTTGFRKRDGRYEFTWPIWEGFLEVASVRSLLSLKELQEDTLSDLKDMGLSEVYRAQRIQIGQGGLYKLNFRPSRAL